MNEPSMNCQQSQQSATFRETGGSDSADEQARGATQVAVRKE